MCATAGQRPPPSDSTLTFHHVFSSAGVLRHKSASICCYYFPLIIGLNNGMPVSPLAFETLHPVYFRGLISAPLSLLSLSLFRSTSFAPSLSPSPSPCLASPFTRDQFCSVSLECDTCKRHVSVLNEKKRNRQVKEEEERKRETLTICRRSWDSLWIWGEVKDVF